MNSAPKTSLLSVIVPTMNEAHNVVPLAQQISDTLATVTPYEIIYVDDSTDDTPQVLAKLSEQNPATIRYLHRNHNTGLARAVVDGFAMARGDVLAVIDGDLQHPPCLLSTMFREIQSGADVVLPSRYTESEKSEGLNVIRQTISSGAKRLGNLFIPELRSITDPTGGYFMLRSAVIADKDLKPIGWKILVEVMALGNYDMVVEVPYEFSQRNADQSKMDLKASLQYLLHLISLEARRMRKDWQ
ncbi:MAG: glycosyltransferase [Actinomycetes bacterium]|jgi:dolichol-phosphate mannosyltransferase|nr:glycosyltransferase [Actinomycetes bacterium]